MKTLQNRSLFYIVFDIVVFSVENATVVIVHYRCVLNLVFLLRFKVNHNDFTIVVFWKFFSVTIAGQNSYSIGLSVCKLVKTFKSKMNKLN